MVRVLVPGSSPSVFRQDLEHVLQDATAQSTGQSLIFQRKEIKQKEKREKRKEKREKRLERVSFSVVINIVALKDSQFVVVVVKKSSYDSLCMFSRTLKSCSDRLVRHLELE